ncbi:MAG TPA: hypothetical protein DCZ95_17110 [Verrucomicrobia bacterium]|nr:MAG: hypothetical protein A2X46_09590 [Lentisphaerae bacterium GWF2_57_35]HBA85805.1 hypothetical protein [Verrucomicrobiota bacterium]
MIRKTAAAMMSAMCALAAQGETCQEYLLDALEKCGREGIPFAPGVTVDVIMEAEASYEQQGDKEDSAVKLATFELGLEANLMPGVRGMASLLWEQDGTEPLDLDTGYIVLGGSDSLPLSLSVGRMYMPFGSYHSLMISDPLTLELGETRETAVGLGYEKDAFSVWVAGFSGELDDANGIEKGMASVQFTPMDGLTLGGGFLSDIAEGGYLDSINEVLDAGGVYERTGAWNVFLLLELEPVTFHAEYVGAVAAMKWTDAEGQENDASPMTWAIEAGYAVTEKITCAVRYEGSDEFLPDEMPEAQYGLTAASALNRFSTLSAEYLYGIFEGAELDDRQMATIQLALTF